MEGLDENEKHLPEKHFLLLVALSALSTLPVTYRFFSLGLFLVNTHQSFQLKKSEVIKLI